MSRLSILALISALTPLALLTSVPDASAVPACIDTNSGGTTVICDRVASAGVTKSGSTFVPSGYENDPTFEGYTNTVSPTSTTAPTWAKGVTFKWGDVIGNPNDFDAYSMTVVRTSNSISFTLRS
jgi:hypothetical protein